MKTPQSPAPVAGQRIIDGLKEVAAGEVTTRPASEQPVEAIGAGREVARMREIAISWRHPSLRQIEGPNDLKIYGGTIADDIDRWADMIAVLSPASPARTPMGGWPEVTDQWAETYCELTGRDPDGRQVTFVDGGTVTTFRDMAKREIEAMLCAAPKPAVRAIAEAAPTPMGGEVEAAESVESLV